MSHAKSVQGQGSRRTSTTSSRRIPVVDLDDPLASEKLGHALSVFGVAALTNHGVPEDEIEAFYGAAQKVFAYPDSMLAKYQDTGKPGYNGFVLTGVERALGHKLEDNKRFHHAHRDCEYWPDEVPDFRGKAMTLFGSMEGLSFRVARLMAAYLRLDGEYFVKMIEGGNNLLRTLHYPAINEKETNGRVRAARHTDINWWTFLPPACGNGAGEEDASKGLQIRRTNDNQWIDVPNIPGAIVIQVGDMLQTHTKYLKKIGKIRRKPFMSTPHRVLNFKGQRFSAPFFVHPRGDVLLTRNMTAHTALMRRIVAIKLRKAPPKAA